MSVIRTTEDGWDCIVELKQATSYLEDARHETYEIDNCVRRSELPSLVEELRLKLQSAIACLNEIDTEVEIVQVDDE